MSIDAIMWIDFLARECALFAAFWFLIGALDDLAVDIIWLRNRRKLGVLRSNKAMAAIPDTEKHNGTASETANSAAQAKGTIAIFIPLWQEANVISEMLEHTAMQWQGEDYRIYAGCYCNDPATIAAVAQAANYGPIHLVVNPRHGPTSKADNLNAIWHAMAADEEVLGRRFEAIVLHDAEDLVDPEELTVHRQYLHDHAAVQLPVEPMANAAGPIISGHYCDEFAEAHGKALPVRDYLKSGVPLAGVGCAIQSRALQRLATQSPTGDPFAADSLTEDYEVGLRLKMMGLSTAFVTAQGITGSIIATRAYFPHDLGAAVRQKSRWMAGIALAGWDRLGWSGQMPDWWMLLRDRRAVLAALVLTSGYAALGLFALVWVASIAGLYTAQAWPMPMVILLGLTAMALLWRIAMRFIFSARSYGWRFALFSPLRMIVGNIIAIMAARLAVQRYIAMLLGGDTIWDKTVHSIVPARYTEPDDNAVHKWRTPGPPYHVRVTGNES